MNRILPHRIGYVRSWVVGLPNHPQLRNYTYDSILWFLESGWLNKRWPYVVLLLDQRRRQWPRMKYNQRGVKHDPVTQYWAIVGSAS